MSLKGKSVEELYELAGQQFQVAVKGRIDKPGQPASDQEATDGADMTGADLLKNLTDSLGQAMGAWVDGELSRRDRAKYERLMAEQERTRRIHRTMRGPWR